ncbi:MAG: ASPIC/UnbV domain-containing protein [Mariniblastus sp.]
MRFGPNRDDKFKSAAQWGPDEALKMVLFRASEDSKGETFFQGSSLSGGERNRMYLQREGNFKDVSLVSGADFREDGRGFVLFDLENDGKLDLGVTSPNAPRFRILKNRIDLDESSAGFVSIQLVGGHDSNKPTSQWSSRDAFGSSVTVTIGQVKRAFQLAGGEGLSGQNTNRIHVGLGKAKLIDRVEIKWPSGKVSVRENVKTGERLVVKERDDH